MGMAANSCCTYQEHEHLHVGLLHGCFQGQMQVTMGWDRACSLVWVPSLRNHEQVGLQVCPTM